MFKVMSRLPVCMAAALLALAAGTADVRAADYTWVNEPPPGLVGTWVIRGQSCENENSQVLIFSDGGYRWRQTRTEWGFARGRFSWDRGSPNTFFRVQRFVQQDDPDFQFIVSGPEMRKYTFGSGKVTHYDRCPDPKG
ncbi:hypothetical protein [Novispirillum itersonii]|uniref:hypothetical protein n=1 Tax=Novispirillum itersonii TaxID=189 RepID=UPI00039F9A78|nr:hypothetical protein [Novispirillum itersonii]